MSEKKLILSLCDHTGNWARYYEPSLYEVVTFDLRSGHDIRYLPYFGRSVHGILAAPPCTEFCIVAAQYWERKDTKEPKLLQEALSVVHACLSMVATYEPGVWRFLRKSWLAANKVYPWTSDRLGEIGGERPHKMK
jgi:hypothetical protein